MIPIRSERAAPKIIGDQGTVQKFTVEANSTAFRILSSSLYSDKPRAIVRELSTNGNDSNKEAGRGDIPIQVNIPNNLNPTFRVSDSGIGMSREVLTTVFATYFKSTKDKSDDYNGTMGLGSKSPLCYTDSMAVTSVRDSEKTVASVYLDDDGEPVINIIYHSYDVDEPNGTVISLGVDDRDIRDFQHAAVDVYTYFDVLPEIEGLNRYDELISDREKLEKYNDHAVEMDISLTPKIYSIGELQDPVPIGTFSKIHRNNVVRGVRVCPASDRNDVVVMSNVAYPVKSQYRNKNDAWVSGVIIYVPNGSVGFTPNREELDYSRRTVEILDKAYIKFSEVYNSRINKKVTESLGDIRELNTLHENFPFFRNTDDMLRRVTIDKSHANYKKLQAQFTEFYWDTLWHLHYLWRAKAATSSIYNYSRKFVRNYWDGVFGRQFSDWNYKVLDTKCVIENHQSFKNIIHDDAVVLCDTRFNRKNFFDALYDIDSLTYVEDRDLYKEIKRYTTKWFNTDCMIASEVFASGRISREEIKTVNSNSRVKDDFSLETGYIKRLHDANKVIVPVVESLGSFLLPDDDYRVNRQGVQQVDRDRIYGIENYADKKFHVNAIDGKTRYNKFRASDAWDSGTHFGMVTPKDYVYDTTQRFVEYVNKNRQLIVKANVMERYQRISNDRSMVPIIRSSRFKLDRIIENFIFWCNLYGWDDLKKSLESVNIEIDVIVKNMLPIDIQKIRRGIRKQVAQDIETLINDVDDLVAEEQLTRAEQEAHAENIQRERDRILKEIEFNKIETKQNEVTESA